MRLCAFFAAASFAAAVPCAQSLAGKLPVTRDHSVQLAVQTAPPAPAPVPATTPAPSAETPTPPEPPKPPRDFTIGLLGAAPLHEWRDIAGKAFHLATGLPLAIEPWDGTFDALRAGIKSGTWDLMQVDGATLAAACDAGLLTNPDWSLIGGKDHYLAAGVTDCGVGASLKATVLAWDRDKLPIAPNWSDFFDVAKYPGRRGLHRGPRGVLEIALLADGVAPGDIYRTLRGADGQDRAFRKLDQLRPYIMWLDHESDALRVLQSGEVLMTAAPAGELARVNREGHHNFGAQWTGGITAIDWWAIVKGAPHERDATQFLYFLGLPSLAAQMLNEAEVTGFPKGMIDFAAPEAQAASALGGANGKNLLATDEGFWHDNGDKLTARFADWLAH
jgi:putative spermidine/putrescine transport system substrate-binding protein